MIGPEPINKTFSMSHLRGITVYHASGNSLIVAFF
jgi:hypothetical protein